MPIQLGGGIRDLDTIESYLDAGVDATSIIGTAAVKNPGFLHDACYAFPGHIIVGLDAKDGKVAVEGWSQADRPRRAWIWRRNTRTTASRRSSTPTSAATAC